MASKTLVKKLDKVFSEYVRLKGSRDGYFTCCSCGQIKPYQQADAGHFINRRWMATRWHEDNVWPQCRSCNRFDEGNASGYALFMLNTYGEEHMHYLRALSRETAKFTDSELTLLIQDYKSKIKELK